MTEHVRIEADGGSRGNPGPAGYGAVVADASTGEVLAERNAFLGVETNNVAEYSGLIAGLEAAVEVGARRVDVFMDSKLVIEQMRGAWQVKNEGLRPLYRRADELRRGFETVTFAWIPREENKRADRLANLAMDAGRTPAAATPAEPARSWAPPKTTPTRIVLMRHGSTAHSHEGRFSGRNDLSLDEAGQAQAAALAARAAQFGAVAVVSSPIARTQQTAALVAAALDLPVQTNDDFAEVDFGAWEGMTFAEARAQFPMELKDWFASPSVAPPGGESMEAMTRRVRRGRDAVIAAYPDQPVVVVTHVSPIKSLVRTVLDAPASSLYRMHLDVASVSIIDYFADGAASLRLFNDTSHLAHLAPTS